MYYIEKFKIPITCSIILLFLFQCALFFNFQVDDSYISFRYSKNLIDYGVWNWNSVGENVEAYTSFIYTILAIIPHYFNIQPIVFFRILGIIFITFPVYFILKERSLIKSIIPLFFIIINPLIYIHSFSGLETPLFILLIFLLYYHLNKYNEGKISKTIYLILLLLPLTRPEGAIFTLSIVLISFLRKDYNLKYTLILFFSCIVYFILRYKFFGYLFPNTFYVKSVTFADKSFYEIIRSIFFSIEYYLILITSLFLFKSKYIKIIIINSLIILFYYNYSNLMMNYNERFNFQIIFPLLIFLLYHLKNKKIFLPIILLNLLFLAGSVKSKPVYLMGLKMNLEESHGLLGKSLNEFKNQGLKLCIGDVGMVPYFSEWETIDFIGLANNKIAQNGLNLDYIKDQSPDLIVLYSYSKDSKDLFSPFGKSKELFLEYFDSNPNYEMVGSINTDSQIYLLCFLKKDINSFQEIKEKIRFVEKQTL